MDKNKSIKILIVDDHAITRNGIKTLLSVYDDMELVGEASNGKQAIEKCRDIKPDVVLMDLDIPIIDGVAATKEIVSENPEIKVVALTSFASKKFVGEAIKAGATSYIIKNISPREIAETIREAFKGNARFSPEATHLLLEEIKEPSKEKTKLTDQEIKVLGLMVKGSSNKLIAEKLFISENTVKFHISNILSKLGASNRAEAAVIATKNNYI